VLSDQSLPDDTDALKALILLQRAPRTAAEARAATAENEAKARWRRAPAHAAAARGISWARTLRLCSGQV
jgi:hypothetical protein